MGCAVQTYYIMFVSLILRSIPCLFSYMYNAVYVPVIVLRQHFDGRDIHVRSTTFFLIYLCILHSYLHCTRGKAAFLILCLKRYF